MRQSRPAALKCSYINLYRLLLGCPLRKQRVVGREMRKHFSCRIQNLVYWCDTAVYESGGFSERGGGWAARGAIDVKRGCILFGPKAVHD